MTMTAPKIALMNFEGISLMSARIRRQLAEVILTHRARLVEEAEADYEAMFTEPSITARALAQIEELESSLAAAKEELHTLNDYWLVAPWVEGSGHADPRLPPEDPTYAGCPPLPAEPAYATLSPEGQELQRKARAQRVIDAINASDEEHRSADGAYDDLMAAAGPGGFRGAIPLPSGGSMLGAGAILGGGLVRPSTRSFYPFLVQTSGPKPEFDPDLLAAKGVTNVEILTDVRTRTTVGKADPEFVVGGPPVVWLKAEDGTKVAVLQKDFARIGEIFSSAYCNPPTDT